MNKKTNIFDSWPYFGKEEIRAVNKVLVSGRVNQWTGNQVYEFEREYAKYLGVKFTVALANGSVALDVALSILGIGKGDRVIVPCRSFVASASCIVLRGAIPVFADIDPDSQNITLETVKQVWTSQVKAIIAVHLAGWPNELDKLRNFCDLKKIYLIEDCAQAHGAKYKGKPVGSYGDIACFSFCQDKIMTTGGEGGLLATNNPDLWKKAWSLKDHGKDYDTVFNQKHSSGFRWLIKSFGTNYRMTEMQAAIGRIMLSRLDSWVIKRRRLAYILTEGFKKFSGLRVTQPAGYVFHSYYKYYVFIRPGRLNIGWSRDRILQVLLQKGIPCGVGACPEIYREVAFRSLYKQMQFKMPKRFKIAKEIGETSLMFEVHPRLNSANMYYILENMQKVLAKAIIGKP
jgi:dTDP-4-amino-4,6-dideoxygalactose transaminase